MREKLLKRNFMIILVVGILLIIGGISALNEIRTAPSGYFLTEDVAEINEENETIGTVLLFAGVGLCVVSFIYRNSAKARLLIADREEKKIVACNVTNSLIMAFPILKNDEQQILDKIQNANMFWAQTEKNLPKVNYFYENHKIYFYESIDINKTNDAMIHEIIHFMQDVRKKNGKLDKIGLCNFNELSLHGLGINEGAVQYISSKAVNKNIQTINKGEIILRTISPEYYPILTNLIEQIVLLMGENELVKAIILNDDKFEELFFNTFEENAQTIINQFDEIINYNIKNNSAKNKIEELKSMYIETQDLIMRTYFEKQYKLIETEEDVQTLSAKLDKYVELTGKVKVNDYYYNNSENYKSNFMNKLDLKLIKLHEQRSKMALTVVYGSRINKLINKIKALFKLNT